MIYARARIIDVQTTGIDRDFSCWIERDECAIHGTRSGAFEIHAFAIVAAAVAGALEFIFGGLPFGSAAQVRAAGENYEHAIRFL